MAFELEMAEIDREMEKEASNYERLQELIEEKENLKSKIDSLYENWVELSEKVY